MQKLKYIFPAINLATDYKELFNDYKELFNDYKELSRDHKELAQDYEELFNNFKRSVEVVQKALEKLKEQSVFVDEDLRADFERLKQIEAKIRNGMPRDAACFSEGISQSTYYRKRKQFKLKN